MGYDTSLPPFSPYQIIDLIQNCGKNITPQELCDQAKGSFNNASPLNTIVEQVEKDNKFIRKDDLLGKVRGSNDEFNHRYSILRPKINFSKPFPPLFRLEEFEYAIINNCR